MTTKSQDKQLMPTEEMIEAGEEAYAVWCDSDPSTRRSGGMVTTIYLAMEAARPTTDVSTDGLVDLALDAWEATAGTRRDMMRNALNAAFAALQRSNAELRERLRNVCRCGELVMVMLEDHGPEVVPHLIDTDDNPGEYLRQAMVEARKTLSREAGHEE